MKKFLSFVAIGVLLCTQVFAEAQAQRVRSGAVSQRSSADVEGQRQQKQGRIEELQKDISEKKQDRTRLQAELDKSEKEIRAVRESLSALAKEKRVIEKRLSSQKTKAAELEGQLAKETEVFEELKRQMLEVRAQQQNPDWAYADPNQRRRAQVMLQLLSQKSSESIERLKKSRKNLERVLTQSKKTSSQLAKTESSEKRAQESLRKERRARQRAVAQLDKELSVSATTLKKLQKDEGRLAALVTRLQAREAKAQAQSKVASAGAAKKEAAQIALRTAPGTGSRKVVMPPVEGKQIAGYGQVRKVGNQSQKWKGIVYSVENEQPVHAVRAGKVVFSDYLRGYGNLLIIDHGKGYFSVYGNNVSLNKDIGDSVQAGDVISRVGKNDGSLSVLYFEIRHNGKPINPVSWINS